MNSTARDASALVALLERLEGRGYKAYKDVEGRWRFDDFVLSCDHAQGDPFADPSRFSVFVTPKMAGLEPASYRTTSRAWGTAAFLARAFAAAARAASRTTGSGKSGELRMAHPGQTVLPQTAVRVDATGGIEARFTVGLPARGRRVLGREAARLLGEAVPQLVRSTLLAGAHDAAAIEESAAANEDADALRDALAPRSLVAFVADGALLPRLSGIDDRPLSEGVIAFEAPASLRVEIALPNAGVVAGMGVPEGVTLVVGGGFHGKSTLLRALERGVYNHRPGDGRERVVTRADAVKVRSEDGRSVAGVDISAFIDGLPFGRDTTSFATQNASGSTSQAAAIVEALEAGARVLLLDEDTSATNFMIRDRRMQELVPKAAEPITPFVDRVRELYELRGVSSVLVLGGSGDYLDVADTVLRMRDYRPEEVTREARAVAAAHPTGRTAEAAGKTGPAPAPRRLTPGTLDARRGHRTVYVKVPDDRTLLFGEENIDLVAVEQLVGRVQMRAVGAALAWLAGGHLPAGATLPEALDAVEAALRSGGLDALDERRVGDLASFRRFELAAALNRLRSLRVV